MMATDERFDDTISNWLEQTAPARLPERVLEATFERTRRSRQQVGWRALLGRIRVTRSVFALGMERQWTEIPFRGPVVWRS